MASSFEGFADSLELDGNNDYADLAQPNLDVLRNVSGCTLTDTATETPAAEPEPQDETPVAEAA